MNNFGKRLDDLAEHASRRVELSNPALAAHAEHRPPRRALVVGLVGVLAIVAMFFAWQGINSATTELVTAQDPGDYESVGQADCGSGALLSTLQAGMATFDYNPAGSYRALRDSSLAVVSGNITSAEQVILDGRGYLELTLDNVTDLDGQTRDDVDVVAYDWVWADRSQPNPLAAPLDTTGVRFFGLLNPWSGVRGGWSPGTEGFYLACNDDAPLVALANNAAGPGEPRAMSIAQMRAFLAEDAEDAETVDDVAQRRAAEEARVAEELARIAAEEQALIDGIPTEGAATFGDLASARAAWNEAEITDYRFDYFVIVPQGQGASLTVTVENGEAVSADVLQAGSESTPMWSVDDLFDLIGSAAIVREAMFDPVLGYPTLINIDPDDKLPGDELRIEVSELFQLADIDAAATNLAAWLPAPIEEDQTGTLGIRDPAGTRNIGAIYQLHTHRAVDIFLYEDGENLCIHAARSDGSDSSTCQSATSFAINGAWLSSGGGEGQSSFVVVPPVTYWGESWSLDIDTESTFDIDQTDRSVLVVFDAASPRETGTAILRCDCGDRAYSFSIG